MNNYDKFMMLKMKKDWVSAALFAIDCGRGKSSKAGAWAWADEAVLCAAEHGIALEPGPLSWPDFDAMEAQLK